LPFIANLLIFSTIMRPIRPPALKKGDVIGVCAPASPPLRDGDLQKGIAYLEGLGYRVEPGRSLHKKDGYLAGSDRGRAADLNSFFRNRKVRAIISIRGGYGSMRILDMLDYRAARDDPKIFVGYSDLTAIQLALFARCGLVTFAGPMVAAGMARGLKGEEEELFWRMLTSKRPIGKLATPAGALFTGTASGVLLGGNLSIVSRLAGTPHLPSLRDRIVLFEEVGERPYRVDRMLQHLRLAGALAGVRGVVLGRFTDCKPEEGKPSLTLPRIFRDMFGDLGAPVITGVRHGHVPGSLTLPVGLRVTVRAGKKCSITFPGSAVV
jgi:muramoyltetrapeptide carboxypeptidase